MSIKTVVSSYINPLEHWDDYDAVVNALDAVAKDAEEFEEVD